MKYLVLTILSIYSLNSSYANGLIQDVICTGKNLQLENVKYELFIDDEAFCGSEGTPFTAAILATANDDNATYSLKNILVGKIVITGNISTVTFTEKRNNISYEYSKLIVNYQNDGSILAHMEEITDITEGMETIYKSYPLQCEISVLWNFDC
ncbi:MAG: hypothetical protein HON90_11275 [Halobacteriovoraceae bacterium]|jgi:hypothetical protein|nr:hypothetical protein [Halobacteriovoraceae bacterium]